MKKLFLTILLAAVLAFSLCSCAGQNELTVKEIKSGIATEQQILPKAKYVKGIETQELNIDAQHIISIFDKNYYALQRTTDAADTDGAYVLIDKQSSALTPILYPQNTNQWIVGANDRVVMQNRYLFEWKAYDNTNGDNIKLVCLDSETATESVIDEIAQESPFIYFCPVDDERFLCFSTTPEGSSGEAAYTILSNVSLYNIDGSKKQIISERYQNLEAWEESKGQLLEHLDVYNNEIYAYGRKRYNGNYQHYIYHYNLEGKLIEEIELPGFDDIIQEEQPVDFAFRNGYIAFRTYGGMQDYICQYQPDGIKIVAHSQYLHYCVADDMIYFIDLTPHANQAYQGFPLYALDTKENRVTATEIDLDCQYPDYTSFLSVDQASLLLQYTDAHSDSAISKKLMIDIKKL